MNYSVNSRPCLRLIHSLLFSLVTADIKAIMEFCWSPLPVGANLPKHLMCRRCLLQCSRKTSFCSTVVPINRTSQYLHPCRVGQWAVFCRLPTYRERSVDLPCSVHPTDLDVEQSKKKKYLFSASSAFSRPGELWEWPFPVPSVLALQLVVSIGALNLANQHFC